MTERYLKTDRSVYDVSRLVASQEATDAFMAHIGTRGPTVGTPVPPPIFRRLLQRQHVVKCPRTLWVDNNVETMEKGINENSVVYLAQNSEGGMDTDKFGTVYYAHFQGVVISCNLEWMLRPTAKRHYEDGTADMLMHKKTIIKKGRTLVHFLVRKFYILTANVSFEGYRFVNLCDEQRNNHTKMTKIGVIVQSAFTTPRPSIHHDLDHGGQIKSDDSVENTIWKLKPENQRMNS